MSFVKMVTFLRKLGALCSCGRVTTSISTRQRLDPGYKANSPSFFHFIFHLKLQYLVLYSGQYGTS